MFSYCTRVLNLSDAEADLRINVPTLVTSESARLRLDVVANPRPTGPDAPAVVLALAPSRYKVQFTASQELHHKLARLRELMRSKVPDGVLPCHAHHELQSEHDFGPLRRRRRKGGPPIAPTP